MHSHSHRSYCLAALMAACLLNAWLVQLAAAPGLATVAQVGPPASAQSHHVLLTWHAQEGFLPPPAVSVHRKAGLAATPGDFSLLAVVQPTADVPTLTLLLQSAAAAGFDLSATEQAVDGLLAGLPPAGPGLAGKLSAALLAPLPEPQRQVLFDLLPRMNPPVALALGRGFIAEVSSAEPSTFEVRVEHPGDAAHGTVLASVTTGTAPVPLPAPGALSERIETSPRGHLRVQLRWCTPPELAKRTLHVAGFQLYRARRAAWIAAQGNPPPAQWTPQALQEALTAGLLERVNRSPIQPDATLACGGVLPPDAFFVADDNDSAQRLRHEPGGEPFLAGEQVTYYIAALDHFRRPGLISPGLDVVVCDRMPPRVPVGVRVENRPHYDAASQTGTEHLVLSWNRAPTNQVAEYWIYRWNSHTDALRHGPDPGISNLLARVPNAGGEPRLEFVDDGTAQLPAAPPAPLLPGDAGRTFWYTVRGEAASACLSPEGHGTLSGPGAPAFGVLRQWSGPGIPEGPLKVRCCGVAVTPSFSTVEATNGVLRLRWQRTGPAAWVELREQAGMLPLRRYEFPADAAILDIEIPAPGPGVLNLESRAGSDTGQRSPWVASIPVNTAAPMPRILWNVAVACSLVDGPCDPGFADPADPGTGEITGVCGDLVLAPGTVEWRVYRRTDLDPRLVQVASGKVPATAWCDGGAPATPARLCYFAQAFDRDGNPSALARLGCLDAAGTEPMPRPEIIRATVLPPSSPVPVVVPAEVLWFCPPPGVERFELAFRPPPPGAAEVRWLPVDGAAEMIGTEHGIYPSPRIPAGFGNGGSQFAQAVTLLPGVDYRVRVRAVRTQIAENGGSGTLHGPWSDEVPVSWVQGVADSGPQVPWPARPVPGIHPEFHPWAEYDPESETGRVEIGTIAASDVLVPGGETVPAVLRLRTLDAHLSVPPPFVVYRHETSPGHRGDMVQISPLFTEFRSEQIGTPASPQLRILDPFVLIRRRADEPAGPFRIWIRDTQPVIRGKTYRYTLVRHHEDREVHEVLASTLAQIPE